MERPTNWCLVYGVLEAPVFLGGLPPHTLTNPEFGTTISTNFDLLPSFVEALVHAAFDETSILFSSSVVMPEVLVSGAEPSVASAPNSRRKQTRSVWGCLTCRRRKVKANPLELCEAGILTSKPGQVSKSGNSL